MNMKMSFCEQLMSSRTVTLFFAIAAALSAFLAYAAIVSIFH